MRNSCLLTITSLLLFICSSAQDEPCNAISLDCNVQAINGNFDDATFNPDILPTGCPGGQSSNSEGDIWFTFEADGEHGYLFYSDFNSQIPDHFVLLYTGPECNDLTKVRDCHLYESFHEAFPAGTYYAQVIPKSNSAQNNEYTAGLLCSPVPENDERCNATPVSCGNTYNGSFIGSSRTEFINCYCASGGGAESLDAGDVWFELDAVPGATYNIIGQDGQAIKIFETDGCTGDITQTSLCCTSQDILSFSGDGLYYISVRPENLIARKKINYQITIECTTPPDNNLPCEAIEVSCDTGPITGTTVNAGSNATICSGSFFQTPPMVWYKYISDFEGEVELYLCSVAPTFNAIASVYRGNCDSLSCYDFGGGCISGPESFDVSPGETYYLAIHGFGGANEGEFTLTLQCEEEIFCPALDGFEGDPCDDGNILTENTVITADCECVGTPIPPGALCENAIPINDNSFFVDYFNPSEFIDPPYYYSFDDIPPFLDSLESDDVSFGCYQANGVVFSFTPDEDRFVDITVSDWVAVEPNITILTGCPFTTAHISKGCNDGEFTAKTVQNFYALADTTYYILIDGDPDVFGPFDVRFQMEVELKKICPELGLAVGDACDDGDPLTIDDIVTSNCECSAQPIPAGELCEVAIPILETPYFIDTTAGTTTGPFGMTYLYSYNFDDIPVPAGSLESGELFLQCFELADMVFSFNSPVDRVLSVEFEPWQSGGIPTATILTGCPFATTLATSCATSTGSIVDFYAEANTEYFILVDGGDPGFPDGILFNSFEMTVTAPKACPELDGKEGDSCDDGDLLTENDVITPDCECLGQIPNPLDYCSDPLSITAGPGLTASPNLFDASDAVPSPLGYCDGSNEERADSWFSYEAVSSNMAIGVKGVGDYDAVLEVYDACGGNRIKCRNGGEEGDRETVLVSNSVIGQEYLYRVYERGGNPLNFSSFRTSVTFFPSADIEQADCDQGVFATSDVLTATIPEFEYSVSKWTWQFTELESPFDSYEVVSPNGSNPNFALSQFPQIEEGRSYSVQVRAAYLNLEIDGDYGEACEITVVEPNGIETLASEGNWVDNEYTFDIFPNPNDGSEVNITLSNLAKGQNTVQLRIYDFVGKLVMNHQVSSEGEMMNFRLPLVELANGVYIVKINVNDQPLDAKKLVIR